MNEQILNDFLARHQASNDRTVAAIERAALIIQQAESEKTPSLIRPTTINLQAGIVPGQIQALQILRKDDHRRQVVFYNQGPGDVLWSNAYFDPASILAQFSDPLHPDLVLPMPNQSVPIGFLVVGATITIIGTDAIWAYNNGVNAIISFTESIFNSPRNVRSPTFPVPGLDGALGAGYELAPGVDGNPVVTKGLR